jgi:hypothetical protein
MCKCSLTQTTAIGYLRKRFLCRYTMTECEIYLSIAERFLAGSAAVNNRVHELSGFACYHAFESVGGAFVTGRGRRYPRGHKAKLNAFVTQCRAERFNRAVAALAIKVNGLRNLCLYPTQNGPTWSHPMSAFTASDATQLHRRVSSVVGIIRSRFP